MGEIIRLPDGIYVKALWAPELPPGAFRGFFTLGKEQKSKQDVLGYSLKKLSAEESALVGVHPLFKRCGVCGVPFGPGERILWPELTRCRCEMEKEVQP